MFKKLTKISVSLVERFLPNAFIFAILLTIITFIGAIAATGQTVMEMVVHWGGGVWSLLEFTLQMALVLIFGNAFASSRPVKRLLEKIASIPKTGEQAIVLVTIVSALACWLNWGFGLIAGSLLARELAKKVPNVDYRLLIAAAFAGLIVWHGGISGSIPLTLATDAGALELQTLGAVTETIPVTETIFSLPNLLISLVAIAVLPFINLAMHPEREDRFIVDPELLAEQDEVEETTTKSTEDMTPAERLENSRILSILIVILAASYLVYHFATNGFDLNLNVVNLIFLTLGILFHGTPIRYVQAINGAITGASGILLQFPFYAGIMGMMTGVGADGVSLAGMVSTWFVSISNEYTLPMFSFWAGGLVNFFVPSGGGQWAVQAPVMMPAGNELGIDPAITGMAISWGDAWTNMIQPFWALPALAIAKLDAKDIMGYTLLVLIVVGAVISLGFLGWAFLAA